LDISTLFGREFALKANASNTSRRNFISASLAAVGLSSASLAARPSVGLRGQTIDCQSHLYMPDMVKMMEQRQSDPVVYRKGEDRYVRMGDWHRKILPKHMDLAAKLADMDANGIAITAISINDPGPEWFGKDGSHVAQVANDFIAGLVRKHPSRLIGLCVLPLHDMKAAMAELDRCVKKLGMRGILFYTNILGRFPDSPEFRPVFGRKDFGMRCFSPTRMRC
jgi:predicted TIM-barrel fold metal-dependent hydrolase